MLSWKIIPLFNKFTILLFLFRSAFMSPDSHLKVGMLSKYCLNLLSININIIFLSGLVNVKAGLDCRQQLFADLQVKSCLLKENLILALSYFSCLKTFVYWQHIIVIKVELLSDFHRTLFHRHLCRFKGIYLSQ